MPGRLLHRLWSRYWSPSPLFGWRARVVALYGIVLMALGFDIIPFFVLVVKPSRGSLVAVTGSGLVFLIGGFGIWITRSRWRLGKSLCLVSLLLGLLGLGYTAFR